MNSIKEMSLDSNYQICLSNDLIKSQSELSLNATKLLRIAIMQIVKEDKELNTYQIKIMELAKFLNISKNNLYRDAQSICMEMLNQKSLISDGNPTHGWIGFTWVQMARYTPEDGLITIRLNDILKPQLLELSKNYTSYMADNILNMKSVYAIRIYELIKCELKSQNIRSKRRITLSISEIRKATATEEKLLKTSNFKTKVIDIAVQEINKNAQFEIIEYGFIKENRAATGIYFDMESKNKYSISPEKELHIQDVLEKAKKKEVS